MPARATLVSILLLAAASESAAARQPPLHAALTAARVAEPANVAAVLQDLSLDSSTHCRADLASLSSSEQAEMVAALRQGGVALGDRSRLRVWASSEAHGTQTQTRSAENNFQRRLQDSPEGKAAAEDKGVSSDTIAIILTGLTAVAGYILQARQAAAAERAQAQLARESDRAQNAADIRHQQREVQTQRAQDWMELAQKTLVAFARLVNVYLFEFNLEFYDTVLTLAPPDPALTPFKQYYQMTAGQAKDKMTPAMLAKVENEENYVFVDGVVAGCHNREYGRNLEGGYAAVGVGSAMMALPYIRFFRESLIESMAAEPSAPLARRFRMFVEHRLMPAIAELAELLHEKGALLEWPTTAEMAVMFPWISASTSREMMMFNVRSYYQAWTPILKSWTEDNFEEHQPHMMFPCGCVDSMPSRDRNRTL
jgi:hypothetical protein